jgi:hypothetical protein
MLISLTNSGVGHSIPTVTPLRMTYLKVTGMDSSGKTIWQNWKDNPIIEDRPGMFMRHRDKQENAPLPHWKESKIIYDRWLLPGKLISKRYLFPEGDLYENN